MSAPAEARPTAAAGTVRRLVELIRDRDLRAGERLPPERVLAATLGVSRPTLREAIRALVVMNILVARRGDGTYVSSLDPELLAAPLDLALSISDDALDHLFEVRKVLEVACARLAADRISDDELVELERLVGREEDADPEDLLDRDLQLHTAIVRAARNPILIRLMGVVASQTLASRLQSVRLPDVLARSPLDHRAIVEALRSRSPAAAEVAMAAHLEHVQAALHSYAKERA